MRIPKLSTPVAAAASATSFLFHLTIVGAALLKLTPRVWNVYKYHGDALDLFFLGLECVTFVISVGIWFFADTPLSRRFLYSGVLFPVYCMISLIANIIVSHIYGVAVGGY